MSAAYERYHKGRLYKDPTDLLELQIHIMSTFCVKNRFVVGNLNCFSCVPSLKCFGWIVKTPVSVNKSCILVFKLGKSQKKYILSGRTTKRGVKGRPLRRKKLFFQGKGKKTWSFKTSYKFKFFSDHFYHS